MLTSTLMFKLAGDGAGWRLRRLIPPLVLALFLLPALLPLLGVTAVPCTHDDAWHMGRVTALRGMLGHGLIFSRWLPNLALGYGYPFFNYREPLPYLVGEALYVVGVPLPLSMGFLYAASLIGAAWGAYVLARDLFGERAAWITAVAYGLGPYLLLDALRRGNMPESVALALLPWLFVAFRRVVLGRGLGAFVVSVTLLVALFLSHNISSLLLAPFLGSYVVLLAWHYRDRRDRSGRPGWVSAFVAVAVAVLLTAWFWLPALTEQEWVQLNLSRTTRNNDFHYNFLSWREALLTVPAPHDPAFLNPPMRIYLGVGRVALALAGVIVGLWRFRDGRRRLVIFLSIATFSYLWLSTPSSLIVWEAVDLLSFVQFPWRMVGRALLPLSLLAGAAFEGRLFPDVGRGSRRMGAPLMAALTLMVVLTWPDTYPPKGMCAAEPYPDMADVYARERAGWLGMDPESSYVPIWVEEHPESTDLAEAFMRGTLPERFDPTSLPEGGEVVAATYYPLGADLVVRSPETTRVRWLGFYFPGWRVWIDGRPVPVAPEDDSGLLTFSLPGGEHNVRVRFGATPMRRLGTGLAAAGIVLFAVILWMHRGHSARVEPAELGADRIPAVLGIAVLALILLVVRLLVVGRVATPVFRSRLKGGETPEVGVRVDLPFEGGVTLLGVELPTTSVVAGEEVPVELVWAAREPPSLDGRTGVLLVGPDGQSWSPAGTARPRGYEPAPPMRAWQPGQYMYDPHQVLAPPGTPPGMYEIVVSLFDRVTLTPASVLDEGGQPLGPDLTVGTVQIEAPKTPPDLDALDVAMGARLRPCGPLGVWAMEADRSVGAPGDVVAIRWVWEALAAPAESLAATVTLHDAGGSVVETWTLPPAAAWWPTDRWEIGDRWVGHHVLRLPGGLESGAYRLALSMPACPEGLASVALDVNAPERVWAVPAALTSADVTYGLVEAGTVAPLIRLAGYDLGVEREHVSLSLAWQALTEITTSYRVFVHLVDAEGRIVVQHDGVPVGWTRPTTGWAPGEVVVDVRELPLPDDLPPGTYQVRVGWYGEEGRLATQDGADFYTFAPMLLPPQPDAGGADG